MTSLLSDRARWLKIALLVQILMLLGMYIQWAAPNLGSDWQRALVAQAGPPGRAYDLYHRPVLRLVEGGFVVGAGKPLIEITCQGDYPVRPGDWVDLAGRWQGGMTVELTDLHVHRGNRSAKLVVSLVAALAALGLVAARFRIVAWRLVPRSGPAGNQNRD